jgi:hypothetical protein
LTGLQTAKIVRAIFSPFQYLTNSSLHSALNLFNLSVDRFEAFSIPLMSRVCDADMSYGSSVAKGHRMVPELGGQFDLTLTRVYAG